jgi:hypothetical protein
MEQLAEAIVYAVDVATCTGQDPGCVRFWPLDRRSLAMALVTKAKHESDLAEHIHKNECRLSRGECDPYTAMVPGADPTAYAKAHFANWEVKRILLKDTGATFYVQQSYSPFQIKKFADIPEEHWGVIESGFKGTSYAALYAAKRLSSGYKGCQETIAGAFARYATGNSCHWKGSEERVLTWNKLMAASLQELEHSVERRKKAAMARVPLAP